ncbi:hypothetical protein [Flavobacterium gilvum]|uniref:Uncharacterized protein n=1 Tax=Flavobacterium gilvum TaxID=1492737 RepID=A0AAC9I596_9FLAO|nr:hypothetical protein [Flavobacterium gilvum]AOW10355.1 hypothetical protein EM308_13050 [Flavobacterium gilvum]KFC60708.1 hypothetical protein FEM08_05400 [Flavobacterium gilvum]
MVDNAIYNAKNITLTSELKNMCWKDVSDDDVPNKILKKTTLFNDFTDNKKKFGLKLLLSENIITGLYSLSITGSIRKWYFKENSRSDLTYDEFIDCIEKIEYKLGLKKGKIWKLFEITQLEIGITLLLKSYFHNVINCFVRYRNSIRDNQYESTVYFKFQNYEILFYDKFLEMYDLKVDEKKTWTKNQQNVFNKFHFLRFEISATTVSGTKFKDKYDTLELLRDNWNSLPTMLEKYLNDITFVDVISKEKNNKKNTHTGLLNYTDFINRLIFDEIENKGLLNTINLFDKLVHPNNKSKNFKDLLNRYKSNITNEIDLIGELKKELRKKLDRLYNNSKIR